MSRTPRRRAGRPRPRQPQRRPPPPAPRQPRSAPIHRSRRSTYPPRGTSPNPVSSGTRNSPGATRQMLLLITSIPVPPPTTICQSRGNESPRCPFGRPAVASTSPTRTAVATKASRSPVGITRRTEHPEATSPCPMSAERNAAQRSPRRQGSPTMRMGFEIMDRSLYPARHTHLLAAYPVSNILKFLYLWQLPELGTHVFDVRPHRSSVCNL